MGMYVCRYYSNSPNLSAININITTSSAQPPAYLPTYLLTYFRYPSRIPEHKNPLPALKPVQRPLHGAPQLLRLRPPRPRHLDHGGVRELALPYQAQYVVHGLLLGGGVAVGPAAQPEAEEAQVLEDEAGGGQLDGLAGHAAVGHQGAAAAEHAGHGLGALPANAVEAQADAVGGGAVARGQVRDLGLEGAGLELEVRDDARGAELQQLVLEGLGGFGGGARAHDVDAAVAPQPAQLDGGAADGAVGAVLHEPVALAHGRGVRDEVPQHAVRGGRVDGDGGGLQGREARFVELDEGVGGGERVRAPRAELRVFGDDPVALGEGGGGGGDYFEDALVSRDGGEIGRAHV